MGTTHDKRLALANQFRYDFGAASTARHPKHEVTVGVTNKYFEPIVGCEDYRPCCSRIETLVLELLGRGQSRVVAVPPILDPLQQGWLRLRQL